MGMEMGRAFDALRPQLDVVEVREHAQMYEMLRLGRVDYLITPLEAAQPHLNQDKTLSLHNTPLKRFGIHLSLSQKSPCAPLMPEINRIIDELIKSGKMHRLIDYHRKLALAE